MDEKNPFDLTKSELEHLEEMFTEVFLYLPSITLASIALDFYRRPVNQYPKGSIEWYEHEALRGAVLDRFVEMFFGRDAMSF